MQRSNNPMSLVKYCAIHDRNYNGIACHSCIKESASYEAQWLQAAQEIQDATAQKEFAWHALEDILPYIFKLPSVARYLQNEEGMELHMREARVREHLALWVKAYLTNPDNDTRRTR